MKENGSFESVEEACTLIANARKANLPGSENTMGIYRTSKGDIVILPVVVGGQFKTYQLVEIV